MDGTEDLPFRPSWSNWRVPVVQVISFIAEEAFKERIDRRSESFFWKVKIFDILSPSFHLAPSGNAYIRLIQ